MLIFRVAVIIAVKLIKKIIWKAGCRNNNGNIPISYPASPPRITPVPRKKIKEGKFLDDPWLLFSY
jgi:hypothetical protein